MTLLCVQGAFRDLKHLLKTTVLSHRKCLQSTELLQFYTPKIRQF